MSLSAEDIYVCIYMPEPLSSLSIGLWFGSPALVPYSCDNNTLPHTIKDEKDEKRTVSSSIPEAK